MEDRQFTGWILAGNKAGVVLPARSLFMLRYIYHTRCTNVSQNFIPLSFVCSLLKLLHHVLGGVEVGC